MSVSRLTCFLSEPLQTLNATIGFQVGIGLTAGTLGCCVNIPFDVAKSRIQVDRDEVSQ